MSSGRRRQYAAHGLAGCVQQRRAAATGTLVGVYDAAAAGIDTGTPWAVVCETHGSHVGVSTLRRAVTTATDPTAWCEQCRTPATPAALTPERRSLLAALAAERAALTNPIDRIVFDNAHRAELPGLPVGLWLMAFPEAAP